MEPGRTDVVRVMNLHKAKGLEAPVVILAMPFGDWSPPPTRRVIRDESGCALGFATVTEPQGRNQVLTLARPHAWDEHAEEEQRFGRAEGERLLYVAATRAAQELIVGCAYDTNSPSPWRSFHEWLRHNAMPLPLPQPVRVPREELDVSADEMRCRIAAADTARGLLARRTYRVAPVTGRKVEVAGATGFEAAAAGAGAAGHVATRAAADAANPGADAADLEYAAATGRGTDWGTAVHDALQYAAEGASGDILRAMVRSRLVALERPVDSTGEPTELDELLGLVLAVTRSATWERAARAAVRLVEAPFAVAFSAAEYAQALGMPAPAVGAAAQEIVDGRIDLVFREADGWVIVDYKSDTTGARIPPRPAAQLPRPAVAVQGGVG